MKKIRYTILLELFCLLVPGCVMAQNSIEQANNALRDLFSNLSRPDSSVQFLYDMAAHLVDSAYFSNYCSDTSNYINWFTLYDEMLNFAYAPTNFVCADTIYQNVLEILSDVIPIGIMDWNFYLFKEDALTTGLYFDFDTINDIR